MLYYRFAVAKGLSTIFARIQMVALKTFVACSRNLSLFQYYRFEETAVDTTSQVSSNSTNSAPVSAAPLTQMIPNPFNTGTGLTSFPNLTLVNAGQLGQNFNRFGPHQVVLASTTAPGPAIQQPTNNTCFIHPFVATQMEKLFAIQQQQQQMQTQIVSQEVDNSSAKLVKILMFMHVSNTIFYSTHLYNTTAAEKFASVPQNIRLFLS